MALPDSWSRYQDWHLLLDALCTAQGHIDNQRLASEFCTRTKATGQAAYETALKNLTNWRNGLHAPNRRNFVTLSMILNVDSYDGLRLEWNALYGKARRNRNGTADDAGGDADRAGAGESLVPETVDEKIGHKVAAQSHPVVGLVLRHRGLTAALATALVVSAGLASAYVSGVLTGGHGRAVDESVVPRIRPMLVVDAKVGESYIVHGMRSDCDNKLPEWDNIEDVLPKISTGVFSDGGVGFRYSRSCDGNTLARAIRFTAKKPGREEIVMFGDSIVIEVQR
jgi:hypothetical protein